MKNLVVFGTLTSLSCPAIFPHHQTVTVDAITVRCGLVETPDLTFNPDAPGNERKVLVRIKAFSCNYRDRSFIYSMAHFPIHRFFPLGSEFVAEVCVVGSGVRTLRPGDRVISNHHYLGRVADEEGIREGVLTNQASKEHRIVHEKKLVKIPDAMLDEVAAAFSLNAQTAYSMVRRMGVRPGSNVLVTSARSNTSLLLLSALRKYDVNVYATTTSVRFADRLDQLGVKAVLPLDRKKASFKTGGQIDALAEAVGMFDYVFDPMFDVHLEKAVAVMAPFGQYITCGFVGQTPNGSANAPMTSIMQHCISKNLSIHGNCIGIQQDLKDALQDYKEGYLTVMIDSIFTGNEAGAFLDRTFNDRDRFGKVVFQYTS